MTERAPLPRRPPTMGHQVVGEAPGRRAVTCRGPGRGRGSALLALGVLWAGLGPLPARLADAAVPAVESVASPTPLPVVFSPGSVTFVSLSTGWALGTVPCAGPGRCLALRRTVDGGRTWSAVTLPKGLLQQVNRRMDGYPELAGGASLTVRFADLRDGWIFGGVALNGTERAVLWSTRDGGRTWHSLSSLPGMTAQAPIFDLEAARGTVYAMGQSSSTTYAGAVLAASPVRTDAWYKMATPQLGFPAGGANPTGDIVLQGGRGWLVEGNDRGITGSARLLPDGQWAPWSPPCKAVGNSYAVPAAANGSVLYVECQMGGFASQLSPAAPKGAALGSYWLYQSTDGGLHFQPVTQLGAGFPKAGAQQLPIVLGAASAPGSIFGDRGGNLMASFDGGHHWQAVYHGSVSYVGFTSPTQGVAITQVSQSPSSPSSLAITRDGGHHWQTVSF